jgi:uncharacterized metal-binding protein
MRDFIGCAGTVINAGFRPSRSAKWSAAAAHRVAPQLGVLAVLAPRDLRAPEPTREFALDLLARTAQDPSASTTHAGANMKQLVAGHDYRVLTLDPCWAWAVMFGGKDVENRSWATSYRGRILIHASAKETTGGLLAADRAEMARSCGRPLSKIPAAFRCRAILGSVEVVDCVQNARSPWAEPGCVNWVLRGPEPLSEPISGVRGAQKLWRWTPERQSGTSIAAQRTQPPSARSPAPSSHPVSTPVQAEPLAGHRLEAGPVMAAFRSVATDAGAEERAFLRETSRRLGFARMGARVEAALRAHLRTATKRQLLSRDARRVRCATRRLTDYDVDTLTAMVTSLLRRGQSMERPELSAALLQHLGFQTADNSNAEAASPAIDAAVAKRVLALDGTKLRRVG